MKNYMPVLLGLAFIGIHAADMPTKPKLMTMRVQHPNGRFEKIQIFVTPQTQLWDLQNELRQQFGPGDLMIGGSPNGDLAFDELFDLSPNLFVNDYTAVALYSTIVDFDRDIHNYHGAANTLWFRIK